MGWPDGPAPSAADAPTVVDFRPARPRRRIDRPTAFLGIGLTALLLASGVAFGGGLIGTRATPAPSVGGGVAAGDPGASIDPFGSLVPSPSVTASPSVSPDPSLSPSSSPSPSANPTATPRVQTATPKDTTAPTGASVVISGSTVYSTSVTLALGASGGPTQMRIGNLTSGSCHFGDWGSYRTSRTGWPLASGGGGTRTVCAQFRDAAQNPSLIDKDSTYYDRKPVAYNHGYICSRQSTYVDLTPFQGGAQDATDPDGDSMTVTKATVTSGVGSTSIISSSKAIRWTNPGDGRGPGRHDLIHGQGQSPGDGFRYLLRLLAQRHHAGNLQRIPVGTLGEARIADWSDELSPAAAGSRTPASRRTWRRGDGGPLTSRPRRAGCGRRGCCR